MLIDVGRGGTLGAPILPLRWLEVVEAFCRLFSNVEVVVVVVVVVVFVLSIV